MTMHDPCKRVDTRLWTKEWKRFAYQCGRINFTIKDAAREAIMEWTKPRDDADDATKERLLAVYRKHGRTIAAARKITAEGEPVKETLRGLSADFDHAYTVPPP
jgi:hypothetical protein